MYNMYEKIYSCKHVYKKSFHLKVLNLVLYKILIIYLESGNHSFQKCIYEKVMKTCTYKNVKWCNSTPRLSQSALSWYSTAL